MAKIPKKDKIDLYIIDRVKEMRIERNISQQEIAVWLELSTGFIGHIESPNFRSKYNNKHLNEIAKKFKCSPRDFFPEKPI
jgi:transcriptional regulator with XRE-family HTH domain